MATTHLIGLLLGTEEDWPRAFESLLARLDPVVTLGGEQHRFASERITVEPFDLRQPSRYKVVIDRLAHWYYVPREWLKKVALVDDVYLLNNPFTFQSFEKHAAYCAMIRLGLKIPETWLIPHKQPPDNARFAYTAARYNRPFDLAEVAARVGYPLYMKPFDGGAWVGVSRIHDPQELRRHYDDSGERLMHLQAAVEGFDVFARSLSIGPETMVMRFEPGNPMYDRYQVDHGFLSPEVGDEVVTIGRLVNAFFRWEFNSCETLVRGEEVAPIDYANACPDVSLTSLHYYFPWAISRLVTWSVFCAATGRRTSVAMEPQRYMAVGDRGDLTYEEKLAEYRRLADADLGAADYAEFCAEHLAGIDDVLRDYVASEDFDRLLVDTVRSTFPLHEQERFVDHYRGLLSAWSRDQRASATAG